MHGDRKVIFYMNIYSTKFWGFFKTFNNNGFMIFFFWRIITQNDFPKPKKEIEKIYFFIFYLINDYSTKLISISNIY